MSNNQVGAVYQQIIADVVESSRVDFEEGGVDERVLEELRQGWQQKLSQLGVAQFPWDPKEAPPVMQNTPTLPSNSGMYQQIPQQQMPQQIPQQQQQQQSQQPQQQQQQQQQQAPQAALPPMPQMNNAPRIKSEPGLEGSAVGTAPSAFNNTSMAGLSAAERAALNLQGMYGSRAAESIAQLQRSAPQTQNTTQNVGNLSPQQQYAQGQAQRMQQMQQQQQQQAGQQQRPNMTPEQIQQYRQQQAINAQQNLQKLNGVGGAQTDGAGDDMGESIGVVSRVNSQGEEEPMGRIEIDNLIRGKIESMGQSMEGGGLMLPLKQATAAAKRNKRQRPVPKTKSAHQTVPQNDGGDDDYDDEVKPDPDLDEDAINSDLDDPDDGLNDDEDEDEAMGHIMLCMYDKVQRVKNKWKCVMKDGVLTVNGKEYVFHKATGEYEW